MTLGADKLSQNKWVRIVHVFLHHFEHTPTSNIRQLQPRRNHKYVINRNLSCAVTASKRCALHITKTDYIDRVYCVRQSHKTTKWLETNCVPTNRALWTCWFKKLQTSSQLHNVSLHLNRPLLLEMIVAQNKTRYLWNPKVRYRVQTSLQWIPLWVSWIQSTPWQRSVTIHYNAIVPSVIRVPTRFPPFTPSSTGHRKKA